MIYGIYKNDLNAIKLKLKKQKDYLDDSIIVTNNGEVKSLLDISFSANHSVRYYAQLQNKINTITDMTNKKGNVGVFLTITLDGFYRDLLRGNYTRYNNFRAKKKEQIKKSVPNNESLGYIHDKILANEALTVKELYNILNYQNKKFFESYAFKKIRKDGLTYDYIRTTEPHKDGTPHFHIMLYIPKQYISYFRDSFKTYFPAPRNSKKIKDSDDLLGFQTDIRNPTAYILKYILKSFRDVKNNAELDELQAWYVKHRILRCVTSHSIAPQWVYQKIMPLLPDWLELTSITKQLLTSEWSKEDNYISILDLDNEKEYIYDNGLYSILDSDNNILSQFGEKKTKFKSISDGYQKIPKKWVHKNKQVFFYNEYFGKHTIIDDEIIKIVKKPHEMKDYELIQYFNSLDIETVNLQHYGYTKNMMINRGLLDDKIVSIDMYNFQELF